MSNITPKLEIVLACGDWPWPVNRKTSEGGVKKSFLFEPSNVSFSSEAGKALTFFDSFLVSPPAKLVGQEDKEGIGGKGQSPSD